MMSFGLCFNRGPRPNVTKSKLAALIFRYVLLLHADERPDFIALDALGLDVADVLIVAGGAGSSDVAEQL